MTGFRGEFAQKISGSRVLTPLLKKKYPVDFDDELKIGDVRYDDIT